MKTCAVILASGLGRRFGGDLPKQFCRISGKSILEYSLNAFAENKLIDEIILTLPAAFIDFGKNIVESIGIIKSVAIVCGGNSRQASSRMGVLASKCGDGKVLIHDAARPFVSQRIINSCILALDSCAAVCPAISPKDTIAIVGDATAVGATVVAVPPRRSILCMQTPQGFRKNVIVRAHELASAANLEFSDDCGMVKKFAIAEIYAIDGEESNIKITNRSDIKNGPA
jgi:2-C-methyl-D-erythritol 4-phosphate cytidylyltransferase